MFVALKNKNNKDDVIGIENGIKGNKYYCPVCGGELFVRKGDDRAHHFAHQHKCIDDWHYDMTAWHYEWQNQFPLTSQEKVFTFNGKTHRADVFINQTVIEFQHSPISRNEFNDRNIFYNQLGFYVIWVFDVREKDIEYIEDSYYGTSRYFSWKYPIKFLETCDENKEGVTIFLQIDDSIWNRQKNFNDITDFTKLDIKPNLIKLDELIDGFSKFKTKDYYSDVEILDALLKKNYENMEWYNYKLKPNFLAFCDHINNDDGLNYDMYGYCPKYGMDIRYSEECHGCYNFVPKYNGCNYRFKDIDKDNINYIYSLNRDKDGRIIEVDLLVGNNRKKQNVPLLPSNSRTIKYFVNSNPNMRVARFKNTYDGTIVQLGLNNMKKLREKNVCEGKLCGYNNHLSSERIIFNWDKPSWIMIWKKDVGDFYRDDSLISVSNYHFEEKGNSYSEIKSDSLTVCPKCGGMICLIDNGNKVGCNNYPHCDYVIWSKNN